MMRSTVAAAVALSASFCLAGCSRKESLPQEAARYPGVFGPDGNLRTRRILPFERKVHAALKRQFRSNPEPKKGRYASDAAWIDACDKVEAKCIGVVAAEFRLDERTVGSIWYKVEGVFE